MHIRRLPDDVVAQIKSSTAITSLTGVVLELLKNALDAKAGAIEISIDFVRGSCSVDDNGCGISPEDFAQDGCLGKLYCTSKHDPDDAPFGRNGTFLASLSAVSLLSIASRHRDYRSQHAISFHHAKLLERQTPTLSPVSLLDQSHGTRVTVRNLFGNLPVRVKQRAVLTEQKLHNDRLWDDLRHEITGLLLSWEGLVKIKIRDSNNKIVFRLDTKGRIQDQVPKRQEAFKVPRSARLRNALFILGQAGYISPTDWPSWVPVSVAMYAIAVKGAISLSPAPTKDIQYISLGLQPISSESEHNEVYNRINSLFANSAFGVIEESKVTDSNGHPQATGRKGVDRYPMFYLQILTKDKSPQKQSVERLVDDENSLQAVIDVISALVTQWLTAHHYRPRAPRRSKNPHTKDPGTGPASNRTRRSSLAPGSANSAVAPSRDTNKRTQKSGSHQSLSQSVEHPGVTTRGRAFAEWSRVKSGQADFHDHAFLVSKKAADVSLVSPGYQTEDEMAVSIEKTSTTRDKAKSTVDIVEPLMAVPPLEDDAMVEDNGTDDDTISWTDPVTKRTFMLNARTGCQVPQLQRFQSHPKLSTKPDVPKHKTMPSVRMRPKSAIHKDTPWLNDILSQWENPVFAPSRGAIQTNDVEALQGDQSRRHYSSCYHDMDLNTFPGISSSIIASKLNKDDFRDAEVLAQVDRKFILAKVPMPRTGDQTLAGAMSMLVLIDQHAADERVQVEHLFGDMCTPASVMQGIPSSQSKSGHQAGVASILLNPAPKFIISRQEVKHFTTFAPRLAAWGILYDVIHPRPLQTESQTDKEQIHLNVTHLPPVISARCTANPQVLITFLRSTIWKYAQDPPLTSSSSTSPDWVIKLGSCPPAFVELVNSRACRSAIMFNDELSLEQCKELVAKLVKCRFPFVCAHGRPSMVPLLNLGSTSLAADGDGNLTAGKDVFVDAWKKWKGHQMLRANKIRT